MCGCYGVDKVSLVSSFGVERLLRVENCLARIGVAGGGIVGVVGVLGPGS